MRNFFVTLFATTALATCSFDTLYAQTAPVKKVLLEEFTTTLCGMCPPQSHNVKVWYENHVSTSILMIHHAGFGTDAMTTSLNTTVCNYFKPSSFGFAPAIMIDRDVYPWVDSVPYMSVNGFDTIAQRVSEDPAVVGIDIQGTYNSTTRALSVTATATFSQNLPSYNRRLCIYLVEDSLIGSGSGWDQKCYSSSFANTYYPGQWNASTQLITGYPHPYVVRESLNGGVWGPSGTIPNTPVAGTPYSLTANYTVPANFNDSKLKIVAFVAEYGPNKYNRQVLNANDVAVTSVFATVSTGFTEAGNYLAPNVYPVPAADQINTEYTLDNTTVISFSLFNSQGQMVRSLLPQIERPAGIYRETFDLSDLPAGIYFLMMQSGEQESTTKIIVE